MRHIYIVFLVFLLSNTAFSQSREQLNSAEIYEELRKFSFLGSALYVAAHPDDENTRLIAYLSKGMHARTAYLSLTRGDGGQNLIGTEIRDLLGVLRSQELQMARQIDGGQQFFTRANDFGYSKHPDETLEIWDEAKVYSDVIQAIRTFRPDVIINRFDHRTPGNTHGHHTCSAMLSERAMKDAANPEIFPEQLDYLDTWQVRRQFFNTSWWFYGSQEKFAEADKTNLMSLDVGVYYPTLGTSNNEISGLARSKHRSQGFGSAGDRGSYQEYLELINGDMPKGKEDIFEGINTKWSRIKGGDIIEAMVDDVIRNYDFRSPPSSVPGLLEIYKLLEHMEEDHWVPVKQKDLEEIIVACMGLFVEASTNTQQSTVGDSIDLEIEVTNRSEVPVSLLGYRVNNLKVDTIQELESFVTSKWFNTYHFEEGIPFSNPYWLNEQGTLGTFKVEDPALRNLPESPAVLKATITLKINDKIINLERPVIFKKVDPAIGEIRQPFVLIPPATISFSKEMYLFADNEPQKIDVTVRASRNKLKATLQLNVPENWKIEPAQAEVEISSKSMEQSYSFILSPPEMTSEAVIDASIVVDGHTYSSSLINIDYYHIPLQTILLPSQSKIVKVPLEKGGNRIAYIMGAGDKMPESLSSVAYQVHDLQVDELNKSNLNQFSAIIIGIRAFNTLDKLGLYKDQLFEYVHNGGTLVTQYNTSRRLEFEDLAPYPLQLSRERVTDEFAEMRVLAPDHIVMNKPNKITAADFDGWVQERGLYFPDKWDPAYTAILSCNDKGEDPLDGSLLIAKYGEGHYVYTSLSWFRQLPAGVPGAYRLFANILALSSQNNQP